MHTQISQNNSTQNTPNLSRSNPFTFADLKAFHVEKLARQARSGQSIRNQISTLNKLMEFLDKDDDSEIVSEFGIDFESIIKDFINRSLENRKETTVADYKSHLRAFRKSWHEWVNRYSLKDIPKNFTDALNFCYERAKSMDETLTKKDLSKRCGIGYSLLRDWFKGRVKRPNHETALEKIPLLEKALNVPYGTLQNIRIPIVSIKKYDPERNCQIEYRKKQSKLTKKPYWLKEFNLEMIEEWKAFVIFKTNALPINNVSNPDIYFDTNEDEDEYSDEDEKEILDDIKNIFSGLTRNQKFLWRTKNIDQYTDSRKLDLIAGSPGEDPERFCQTALIYHRRLRAIFGFFALEKNAEDDDLRGLGMKPERFSLSYLSSANLIKQYLEFRKKRSGGYSKETEQVINFCAGLLRKETGFLRQQPDYQAKLPKNVKWQKSWDEWCEQNRTELLNYLKDLKDNNQIKKLRNPTDPIKAILDLQRPLHALLDMNSRMRQSIPYLPDAEQITLKRDILLSELLTAHPLRINHYSLMEYREDNSGHIRKREDGSWYMFFPSETFKNHKGAAQEDYMVDVPERLWAELEDYFHNIRPHLLNADQCSYVFLPALSNFNKARKVRLMSPHQLSRIIRHRSKQFLPESDGIGAHAYRHINATDYLKNNPNDYLTAAHILHDKITTVMKEYAHLKVTDGMRSYHKYQDKSIKQWERDHEENPENDKDNE